MKKSKKFVLAGLALLAAITMVLLPLAGCKNDSVPPEVEKQEQGDGGGSETDKNNTVTPKYTVTFNTDGGSTVASQAVESGQKVKEPAEPELEGSWFLGWYSDEDLAKKFDFDTPITTATTVYAKWSYKLHTEPSILTTYTRPNHTDSNWKYVEFGDWPQTIKAEGVDVDETKSKQMGMFTYYVGSDGNHYVKAEEKANGTGTEYQYSNGEQAGRGGTSTKWFKVEPIVWRVLTEDYKAPDGQSTGNALLLAESILTGGVSYYDVYNVNRTVGEATIYPNNYEHSAVRAWLNGLKYQYKRTDDGGQIEKEDYFGKGFLQTAFTQSARDKIADTTVDNRAASTNPASNPKQWNSGTNLYASDTPTTDKIFLLSEAEATTSEYGFDEYNMYGQGNTRIRVTTDYAKATGAYQSSTPGYGGWWWLRSPFYLNESLAHSIYDYGYASYNSDVDFTRGGVVPALSISLK